MVGLEERVYFQSICPFWTPHEPGGEHPWRMGTERPPNMTLLKVAEVDVRESKLIDVEYEGI